MEKAAEDLELARRALQPPVLGDAACFHCQQAVEKALKGLLAWLGAETIPRIHDVGQLVEMIVNAGGEQPPLSDDETEELTMFAVGARYPGHAQAGGQDAVRAVSVAERVLAWVKTIIDADG